MQNTKEKILEKALISFATNGYKGTNLRDLATELNLSKSALYKHFASKEDIWNAVIDRMEEYYRDRFGSPENLPDIPKSTDELIRTSLKMIEFTINDPKIILTRRLLLVGQFYDERARHLATLHFLANTKEMYTYIFAEMMKNGSLNQADPEMLAFCYTAPITALIQQCDREPKKTGEIMEQIKAFIGHFIQTYGKESSL